MTKITRITLLFLVGTTIALNFPPPTPPGAIAPYFNGVFPTAAPNGTWELEDLMPNLTFQGPLRVLPLPNSEDLLVLGKLGEIWRVSLANQTKKLILDIKDRTFKKGEGGSVGMVLHPKFGDNSAPDKQLIFVYYRTKPAPDVWSESGFNRLSTFRWNETTQKFAPNSEEILIQQYDRKTWHNGGGMFFGADEMLYLSLGDEGDAAHQAVSTQRLDGGFFNGVIRIDVDKDPTRSHPIRRQPLSNANPPANWGKSYSQGYFIPNDNPWVNSDGSTLEEFYAIGTRSPYTMTLDEETQQIWLTDVGSDKREEINIIEKGDNLQWPYKEGTFTSTSHQKPNQLIGQEKSVFFEYDRSVGSCIIGGSIYRGTKFPELNGKFLFADYIHDKLMALTNTSDGANAEIDFLLTTLNGQSVAMPPSPSITGIYPIADGRILLLIMSKDGFGPGKIFSLKRKAAIAEPVAKLSDLNVFTDLQTLSPISGLIPYTVNAPLWSDRAIKKRWMAIPNDGNFDTPTEQIKFEALNEWKFPEGTVFVKHFELPLTTDSNGKTTRLETRFFIIGEGGNGYGLTYKWNDEGTDAFLLGGGTSKTYDIEENGTIAFTQKWDFPSRGDCMTCHNANAKHVLGVKTHQLNGDLYYPEMGKEINQLSYLNQLGLFQKAIGAPSNYPKSYSITDESASLETRIRSYLDANCASCHRLGGVPTVALDFRITKPLRLQNLLNFPTQSQTSNPHNVIVQPGAHQVSEIWIRDASLEENRMPPLASNLVDQTYVDALAEWIDNLAGTTDGFDELLVFPNPTNGWLYLRVSDDWPETFEVTVQSIIGQVLFQTTADSRTLQLNLAGYSSGSYVLEIRAGEMQEVRTVVLN